MPRPGSCAPWINGADVAALPAVQAASSKALTPQKTGGFVLTQEQIQAILAESATAATEVLYNLTGKTLTGICGPVTTRPLSRPSDIDNRPWLGDGASWGTGGAFGSMVWFGIGASGVASHFGVSSIPTIVLPEYPVNQVLQVLIDGTLIPQAEWELRDHRNLVRIRPTGSAVPTARYGWPTAQIEDLPDTEIGTFSVTYTFGQDPGSMGRLACKKLAEYLALPQMGDSTHYPTRVTSISRQGVQAMVANVMDVLTNKQLGIWEVDSFILSVNPTRATRQSLAWSPDMGRQRRQQYPSRQG